MTLTIQDLGSLGEFLGSIAVLVTLVYLAAQIRQNSEFVKAATYHSTMRARNEFNFAIATTPELSALMLRAGDKGITLDADERQRFDSLMWGFFNLFEDSVVQHANGLLTISVDDAGNVSAVPELVLLRVVVPVNDGAVNDDRCRELSFQEIVLPDPVEVVVVEVSGIDDGDP